MALFSFLNKFKKAGQAQSEKFREHQREKSMAGKPDREEKNSAKSTQRIYASETASEALVHPHITEKSANLAGDSVYVFRVSPGSNKLQIKKSVSELYRVGVKSVNLVHQKPKTRFLRRIKGHKPGYKKAIVTLKAGDKIEFI